MSDSEPTSEEQNVENEVDDEEQAELNRRNEVVEAYKESTRRGVMSQEEQEKPQEEQEDPTQEESE